MRGKAQRDGRPPVFYRRRTFVATCEYFVTSRLGSSLSDTKPSLWYKNLALISYTSRIIANFMAKGQLFVTVATGIGLGWIWMSPWNLPTSKTPSSIQESGTYLLSGIGSLETCLGLETVSRRIWVFWYWSWKNVLVLVSVLVIF